MSTKSWPQISRSTYDIRYHSRTIAVFSKGIVVVVHKFVLPMPPLHDAAASLGRRCWDTLRRSTHNRRPTLSTAAAVVSTEGRINNVYCGQYLTHHRYINTQQIALRYHSSSPPSSPSTPSTRSDNVTTTLTTDNDPSKSIFSKLWDKYSFEGQKKRIILGERLFRAAQYRANDP